MLWNGLKTDTYDVYLFSFYCESNELGKLRCPDLCLLFSFVLFFLTWFFLISFCLTWFFPVSVFLILFCLTWFSPSGLRYSRIMVLVSGLCLKKFDWLRPQVNWYKKLQDAPLAAVVGRLCRLPCWLVDIPEKWESFYPDYLDYSQNWSFFMTTVCNGLIENQPECEVLLLNYIEMFANLQQFKRWDQGDTTQK